MKEPYEDFDPDVDYFTRGLVLCAVITIFFALFLTCLEYFT